MREIGNCPDCGATIYEGHVQHLCPTDPIVMDGGAFTCSMSFGPFDVIVINRRDLGRDEEPDDEPR